MKEIPLTQGRVALVDDADFDELSRWKWFAVHKVRTWVAVRQTHGSHATRRLLYMHREIMKPPPGLFVDHLDGDELNNVRSNMRLATVRQNGQNRVRPSSASVSQLKGVTWVASRKKWRAAIYAGEKQPNGNAKRIDLGMYPTKEEAARVYDAAARKHFGEFAACNFALLTDRPDDAAERLQNALDSAISLSQA